MNCFLNDLGTGISRRQLLRTSAVGFGNLALAAMLGDEATAAEEKNMTLFTRVPEANIGIMRGAEWGLVVLDVDPRHGGDEALRDIEQEHGALPPTPATLTGGGGTHYLFEHPGEEVRNMADLLDRGGLDLRGDGGFIIAPGSRHVSGGEYLWEASAHPDDVPLAPLPR